MPDNHGDRAHALLSPSSAERWASCPASVRLAESLPEPPESPYAREGTAMHELAELQARFVLLGGMTREENEAALVAWRIDYADVIGGDMGEREMMRHAREYIDLLRSTRDAEPNTMLLLERRVNSGVPSCWGTADAVLVSPRRVTIIDLKYGKGIKVEAVGNPQLRLYGVGALEEYGDLLGDVEEVHCMVFQPRLDHVEGEVMSASDLRAWRDSMIPRAELALAGAAGQEVPFGPSEDACRWCPAAGNCEAQLRYSTQLDFGTAPTEGALTPDMIAAVLPRLAGIEDWIKAVREHALYLAYDREVEIPGYKVVLSGGQRRVHDQDGALAALEAAGHDRGAVTNTKIIGIGELEKRGLLDLVSDFVSKTEGKPALVEEADRRTAISSTSQAALDFQ